MITSNEKRKPCSVYGIPFFRVTVLSFVGLCVGVILTSSTLQLSIIFDSSIEIKRNVTDGNSKLSTNPYVGVKQEDKLSNNTNTTSSRRQSNCISCFQHNFNYVIQNDRICKLYSPNQTVELIVLIMTIHKNTNERMALRATWLSYTKNNTANVRYAFLLGEIDDNKQQEAILKENSVYHDIIKEDFIDKYVNLTYKTIMGFKWASTKCAHAHYVMKTDDDMFVNIPNVLNTCKGSHNETLQKAILGACHIKASPIRNQKSKWFASVASYPEKSYPGFCSGTGYLTSMHVASEVYKISHTIPFFHLEDVYVSLCIRKLGFKLQPISGFNAGRPKMDPCLYKGDKLITAHQLTPVMLKSIWHGKCVKQ
ncbi:beta-1,3-galactosyltransferase 1-like isoform X1 [Mercenaria mercenaria]|uniref:beta-1,3-galactosyltransferase 1-like isoform X1 n=1 Tax=Mercenaria mercenaria TaxID=6596 RepID=UPI00234F718E|nr:beta-1,3-galactosyltransferase 1-like isoform X1 [Mercenaria mercenaria]XP_045173374.2 beta-1,3-galactosyltransferase 1-like isoform X1 [Mercenaria mercenaria]XP_045173375.2 beta-1,3-galactosyltransferase 1-like isoform X1 [Mercenaria mercenaria]XP_045173376.2 beta-1,3-galactosyltransferase 1-like isoform X1 [Mercenaria mercenaria]XP_045173377.2 beta-1,3-galactosyltransferase 1-like isoform X1 [Mercenaria mercenaria]XP_053375791.1 beta-1,3-galactosyltransferase 1-like isoform X1 [Mercenaria